MDIAGIREAFPQFTEKVAPDGRIAFHLRMAGKLLPPERWGDLLDEGIGLYVAHKLTLELEAGKAKDGTGGLDAASGAITGETKTVGGMSYSVTRGGAASAGTALLNGGAWNATIYGQEFLQLARIVGAGGMVV